MSGIAGVVRFANQSSQHDDVRAMCAAMRHRAVDGTTFWCAAGVGLGHCMHRTTPESLREEQPLSSVDGSVVLVMDGRVDDRAALRTELRRLGVTLRTDSDAELILGAYQAWGEGCTDRVLGEYAFVLWDARRRTVFAARDPAGARHFYFWHSPGRFAFASEIKGLLALPGVGRQLNASRMLDFLVDEFDRDDEVGTLYRDIVRLPAGHALRVTCAGAVTWRYWNPAVLDEARFSSPEECVEAFMHQLREAVRDRLRTLRPLGASLSGGLDSSTIVALISRELRDELASPLRTFSLIGRDDLQCNEWRSVAALLRADPWLESTVLRPPSHGLHERIEQAIQSEDEPFTVIDGLAYRLAYAAAAASGCDSVLDGMAGDLMFYSSSRSLSVLTRSRSISGVLGLLRADLRHGQFGSRLKELAWMGLRALPAGALRKSWRRRKEWRTLVSGDLALLHGPVAREFVQARRSARDRRSAGSGWESDQASHARFFTTGLLSFAHERNSLIAAQYAIAPLSPFSDRRLIEFAIRMPPARKLAMPWYKYPLRAGTAGILPEQVRWRTDVGTHPGPDFLQSLFVELLRSDVLARPAAILEPLGQWVDPVSAAAMWDTSLRSGTTEGVLRVLRLFVASRWLATRALV